MIIIIIFFFKVAFNKFFYYIYHHIEVYRIDIAVNYIFTSSTTRARSSKKFHLAIFDIQYDDAHKVRIYTLVFPLCQFFYFLLKNIILQPLANVEIDFIIDI